MRLCRLVLTLFYLAGPLLIISELFKPLLSIPILLLFGAYSVLLASSLRGDRPADTKWQPPLHPIAAFAAFALCVAWVYYSGIGSFAICRWDYLKHNLIFSYLLDQKLPIYTSLSGKDFIVHYSFAYYIAPVRLYQVAHALIPAVTLNGLLLTIYSLALFLATSLLARGRMGFVLVLLVILCLTGGFDVLGMLAFDVAPQGEISTSWITLQVPYNLDWWGIPYAPQSFTMNLYYAPQHFFGALIGTALLYASFGQAGTARLIDNIIVVAASVFWSPYVAVGLAAVAIVLALSLSIHGTILQRLRREGLSVLIAPRGLIVCVFAGALVLAASLFLWGAKPLSSPQLILRRDNAFGWLLTYALNYAPYLFALIFVSWPFRWEFSVLDAGKQSRCPALPKILAGCLIASAAALALSHGLHDDWGMRVTLPLSIMLAVALTQVLFSSLKWSYRATLVVVLAVSSASSLAELTRSVLLPTDCKRYGTFRLEDMGTLAQQYEGRRESLLYRYLVRLR